MAWPGTVFLPEGRPVLRVFGERAVADSAQVGGGGDYQEGYDDGYAAGLAAGGGGQELIVPTSGQIWPRGSWLVPLAEGGDWSQVDSDDFEAASLDPAWTLGPGSPQTYEGFLRYGAVTRGSYGDGRTVVAFRNVGAMATGYPILEKGSGSWGSSYKCLRVRVVGLGDGVDLQTFDEVSGADDLDGIGGLSLVTDVTYWIELAMDGNSLTLTLYDGDPDAGSPSVLGTVTHVLSGTPATDFGAGVSGQSGAWAPNLTAFGVDEWRRAY